MLPLALIMQGIGHGVRGSDRGYDQGKTPEKFEYLKSQGIELFPQDGSGVNDIDALVISTAVEDSIPDVKAAKEQDVSILKRADLLAQNFNQAEQKIAVAGTSGKTTVTGMIGFILHELRQQPTVMNGGVFKNFKKDNPYCSALVGDGGVFVTEADESDGSIALYNPDIAILNNIALDHKSLEELNVLFSDYLTKAKTAILNADHDGVMALKGKAKNVITYSIHGKADLYTKDISLKSNASSFFLHYQDKVQRVHLNVSGEHNVSNALATIAACLALGLDFSDICDAIPRFEGIWRRMDMVGTKNDITVIDDFAHNPDKIAASLKALKQFDGRLLIFFQPHGYGFLKLVHAELAQTFIDYLDQDDQLYMVQPFYAGGTVDRTIDSSHVIDAIKSSNIKADLLDSREEIKKHILSEAKPSDRIVIMGARDDTLAEFALEIYDALP